MEEESKQEELISRFQAMHRPSKRKRQPPLDAVMSENPYRSPEVTNFGVVQAEPAIEGGGIRRWPFFVGFACTISTTWAVIHLLTVSPFAQVVGPLIPLALCAGLLVWLRLTFVRSRNIGIESFWGLCVTIPFLNALFLVAWLALPEGFAQHRKLDRVGITVIAVSLPLTLAVSVVVYFG